MLLICTALGSALVGCGDDGGGNGGSDAGMDGATDQDSAVGEQDAATTPDACEAAGDPCQNGGLCFSMGTTAFICQCVDDYSGNLCQNAPVPEENGWGNDGLATTRLGFGNDRGRAIAALPDDGVLIFGSATTVTGSAIDAMVTRLDSTGHTVNAFDTDGVATYDLGAADEAFFAAAVSADGLYGAGVGYTGAAGATRNALLHVFDVAANTGVTNVIALDAAAEDRLHGVTFGVVGGTTYIYAAGYRTVAAGNNELLVARFTLAGALDTSFDEDGIVTYDLSATGTVEQAKGIVVREDGKIVIVGEIEATAMDNDIVVVGLTADGELDTTFGVDGGDGGTDPDGYVVISFGTGNGTTRDNLWNIDADADGNIVIFGSRASITYGAMAMPGAPGTNRQRVIARVLANGSGFDTTFNGGAAVTTNGAPVVFPGIFAVGLGALSLNVHSGEVEPNGNIVCSGYSSIPTGAGTQAANSIVLVRLLPTGVADPAFGSLGVVVANPFPKPFPTRWGMAEAYGMTRRTDGTYVTTGYGRVEDSQPFVQQVSFRFDTDGRLFTTSGY